MIAARVIQENGRAGAARGEDGASELLQGVRSRVAAEVRRLEHELEAFQDEWPRPPSGARQRFATGWEAPAAAVLGDYAPNAGGARARLTLMRLLQRALAEIRPDDLYWDSAGLGSVVLLEDAERGDRSEYVLMPGDVADVTAGHASLASPIGQALLGRGVGDTIEVTLPVGRRRFHVRSLTTLPALVGLTPREPAGSTAGRTVRRGATRKRHA